MQIHFILYWPSSKQESEREGKSREPQQQQQQCGRSCETTDEEKWKDVLVLSESFIKFFTINFKKSGKKLIAFAFQLASPYPTTYQRNTCVHRECAYSPSCQIKNLNSFLISLRVEYSIYFSRSLLGTSWISRFRTIIQVCAQSVFDIVILALSSWLIFLAGLH